MSNAVAPLRPMPPQRARGVLPRARLWRWFYNTLQWGVMPVVWLRLGWRALRIPALRARWAERRGVLAQTIAVGGIWLHAVSAGEVIAAAPLILRLRERHPSWPLLVTTTTHTGSARAQALLGDAVLHAYAPYDTPAAVARFLAVVQPRLAVFFETELWPNTIEHCYQSGVRTLLVNGRLSARSARGYARLGLLAVRMLRQLDLIACQTSEHAARFLALGVAPDRLQVLGNLKFDLHISAATVLAGDYLRQQPPFAGRHVWIAASTHAGEEAIVLDAHRQIRQHFPRALLVLVPRHPERSNEVARLCAGWHTLRLSQVRAAVAARAGDAMHEVAVVLCDRMGELLSLYATAQVAFVGGSLVDVGGHNLIEPAALGVPVLAGPSDRNFADVVRQFRHAGALGLVTDADALAAQVCDLLADPARALVQANAALQVVAAARGASDRVLQLFEN